MIVYDLSCSKQHRFEGWFGSSTDFVEQQGSGLLTCPECGCDEVVKAPMAPSVGSGSSKRQEGNEPPKSAERVELPPELSKALKYLAKAQASALKKSTWVGDQFAEKAREMHYGEADESPIHGQATKEEAKDLVAEGISLSPLLFPVTAPEELN